MLLSDKNEFQEKEAPSAYTFLETVIFKYPCGYKIIVKFSDMRLLLSK